MEKALKNVLKDTYIQIQNTTKNKTEYFKYKKLHL